MKLFREHPVWTSVLKAIVAIGLLAALVQYLDVRALSSSISHANALLLGTGLLLTFANVGTQHLRWHFLLRMSDPTVTAAAAFSSLMVGFAAGFFTPGQLGEYGGRVVALRRLRAPLVLALGLIDKLYILGVTLLLGLSAAAYYFHRFLPDHWSIWYDVAIGLCSIALLYAMLSPAMMRRIRRFLPRRLATSKSFRAVVEIEHLLRAGMAVRLTGLTLLYFLTILFQYHLFVAAFGPVAPSTSLASAACVLLVKSVFIPITIGDLGIRESSAVFFFGGAGVAKATAFNASLCVFFANVFLPSLLGALMLLRVQSKPNEGNS